MSEYGATEGCPGCAGAGVHNPVCRARFETLFKRIDDRRAEQQASAPPVSAEEPKADDGAEPFQPGPATGAEARAADAPMGEPPGDAAEVPEAEVGNRPEVQMEAEVGTMSMSAQEEARRSG